ncbi:MAG: hypothetical protein QXH07_07795 [Thermoplasmata archaeon]
MEEIPKKPKFPVLLLIIVLLVGILIGYFIGKSNQTIPQTTNQTVSVSNSTVNSSNSTNSQTSNNKTNNEDKKWVCLDYDNNNNCVLSYDKDDIQETSNSTFSVWSKWYGEKIKNLEIELGVKKGLPVSAFDNFSHTLSLINIDCNNQTITFVSDVDYDANGNVIMDYDSNGSSQPLRIVPGSVGYDLYKVVCHKK